MAEVIGVVTGILGATDVILRGSNTVITYIRDIKDRPETLERLDLEIQNLLAIVAALNGFIQSNRVKNGGFGRSAAIVAAVEKCKECIVQLQQKFETRRQQSKYGWALSGKKEIENTIKTIKQFTDLFHFALGVHGWSLFDENADEVRAYLKDGVESLQSMMDALRPIPKMEMEIKDMKEHLEMINTILSIISASQNQIPPEAVEGLKLLQGLNHRVRDVEEAKRWQEIMIWISPHDFWSKHKDVAAARQYGTSEGILEVPEFQFWNQTASRSATLWCNGIPGSGKTVTFSAIVDHLLKKSSKPAIALVYLNYKDATHRSPQILFSTLLLQLVHQSREMADIMEFVETTYKQSQSQNDTSISLKDCNRLIGQIACRREVILAFDALDEIPASVQYSLLSILQDLTAKSNLKIIITSRDHITLNPLPSNLSTIRISATEPDLRLYLESRISDSSSGCLVRKAPVSSGLRKKIVDSIIARANGMFLLAELQIKQLEEALTEREVHSMLRTLPREIDDQYTSYISRVQQKRHGSLGLQALSWIHTVTQPLTATQLLEALSVQEGDTELDETGIPEIESILDLAEGLLTLEPTSGIVRLVHETLQEFLDKHPELLPKSHSQMIKTIQTYLNFAAFDTMDHWPSTLRLRNSFKFLDYAFCHWASHVEKSDRETIKIGIAICSRISNSSILLNLLREFNILRFPIDGTKGHLSLHLAVLWQSSGIVHDILCSAQELPGNEVSCTTDTGITALHLAAMKDSVEIAQILIEHGADITSRDQSGRTPLYVAAHYGLQRTLNYFLGLRKVAPWDMSLHANDRGLTPLHVALQEGHPNCADALIKVTTDIDARTTSGMTPLHYAAQYAPEFMDTLIQKGASTATVSGNGRTVLHWACVTGTDEDCISKLLRNGGDPNQKDGQGNTALHLLSCATVERLQSIEFLVSKGAEINSQDNQKCTALHNAVRNRHFQIAAFLISKGAKNNIQNSDGQIPLELAAEHSDTPDSLWTNLGDINVKDGLGNSFLHTAALHQRATAAENLISRGCEVNAANNKGETPLHLSMLKYEKRRSTVGLRGDVIGILLLHGADPNATSKSGIHPVHYALEKESITLLAMLHEYGAELPEAYPNGHYMLHTSLMKVKPEIFEVLLTHWRERNYQWKGLYCFQFGILCLMFFFASHSQDNSSWMSKMAEKDIVAFQKSFPETAKALLEESFDIETHCSNLQLLLMYGPDEEDFQLVAAENTYRPLFHALAEAVAKSKALSNREKDAVVNLLENIETKAAGEYWPSERPKTKFLTVPGAGWEDKIPIFSSRKRLLSVVGPRSGSYVAPGTMVGGAVVSSRLQSLVTVDSGRKLTADAEALHERIHKSRRSSRFSWMKPGS